MVILHGKGMELTVEGKGILPTGWHSQQIYSHVDISDRYQVKKVQSMTCQNGNR